MSEVIYFCIYSTYRPSSTKCKIIFNFSSIHSLFVSNLKNQKKLLILTIRKR